MRWQALILALGVALAGCGSVVRTRTVIEGTPPPGAQVLTVHGTVAVPAPPPANVHSSEGRAPVAHMTPKEQANLLHKEEEAAKRTREASSMRE
jgi:hypothetical protein